MKRLLFAYLAAAAAWGATTATWEMNGYQDFLRGRMSGLSLTRDGRLVLGPKLETLFTSDQPEIWSVARAADGSLYLGTGRHKYSFYELASNRDRLDEDLLKGFLLTHDSGLELLDSPETVDAIFGAPRSAVEHTLAFLAETYQYVVIDCPPALTEGTRACIAASDQVAIVMTAELPAVRNTVGYIEHLLELGYNPNTIYVVLNRYSKKGPLSDERIESALGRPISLRVPNSYTEVVRAINSGAPISGRKKSAFCAAIQNWAHELGSVGNANDPVAAVAAPAPRGGLRALFGM